MEGGGGDDAIKNVEGGAKYFFCEGKGVQIY